MWSTRDLSLIEKILIILISKVRGISNLVYNITMGEMTKELSKQVQDAIKKKLYWAINHQELNIKLL